MMSTAQELSIRPSRGPTVLVDGSGDEIRVDGRTIDLRTRRSLRLILMMLIERHAIDPRVATPARDVFDAGWSGERASPRAVAARVHTAMYTLRRPGLRGVIIRRDSGYAIDPRVEIRIGGALM